MKTSAFFLLSLRKGSHSTSVEGSRAAATSSTYHLTTKTAKGKPPQVQALQPQPPQAPLYTKNILRLTKTLSPHPFPRHFLWTQLRLLLQLLRTFHLQSSAFH